MIINLSLCRFIAIACAIVGAEIGFKQPTALAQEPAEFFWTLVGNNPDNPGTCLFRKKMTLIGPEQSQVLIATTGKFSLYLNGKLVTKGEGSAQFQTIDTSNYVYPGVNLVAVEINSTKPSDNGLALRFRVKEKSEVRWRAMSIDETWMTNQLPVEDWYKPRFRDLGWLPATPTMTAAAVATPASRPDQTANHVAQYNSKLPAALPSIPEAKQTGATPPSALNSTPKSDRIAIKKPSEVDVDEEQRTRTAPIQLADANATSTTPPASDQPILMAEKPSPKTEESQPGPVDTATNAEPKFEINPEFRIDPVLSGDESGSIIAMAFDEFGNLIFSQEGGTLKVADLSIPYGQKRVSTVCAEIKNCQGLLPINGKLFVTGEGPEGLALYRLERIRPEATEMRVVKTLLKFKGEASEHGPHALTLGPDGMLYCIIGNGSGLQTTEKIAGPYQFPYEADLAPRYEDPSGHSNGVKAPAGTVVRMALDGSQVEMVAGGIRNAYDLVFNAHDDLFVHDSDMESDVGLPWYRPTALYHVTDGIDFGWRSGWAKFPSYYLDTVAPIATTGRGSPAGAICYTHINFPMRYQGALFLADWSEGRILAVKQTAEGSTYKTEVEEFLKGKPLNVTDLDVGEDGALYFCTGGRGTNGGVFRVAWTGTVPEQVMQFENDLTRLVRHPQPTSPWARQNMAMMFTKRPDEYTKELVAVSLNTENTATIRCQALENLFLFGRLDDATLLKLSTDASEQVRLKICYLCGTRKNWGKICLPLLKDESKFVCRRAAESLLRTGTAVPTEEILRLVGDNDHVVATTACRLLEQVPTTQWKTAILETQNIKEFCMGCLALNRAEPSLENSYAILVRCSTLMDGFVNDLDFTNMLRVIELTLSRAQVDPAKIQGFAKRIADEFPTSSPILNRELIRILTYLQTTEDLSRLVEYLKTHGDDMETKIFVAMHMATISGKLDDETRLAVIDFLHEAAAKNNGGSYQLYLARCIRQSTEALSQASIVKVLEAGDRWPYALVPAFYRLSKQEMIDNASILCELDRRLVANKAKDVVAQARLGIIALLAEGKTDDGNKYLRELWANEPDRRDDVIIGLAQTPNKENWTYLIASLPVVDDMTAGEVLNALQNTKLRPVAAQHYRDLLELGYRLRNERALQIANILKMWTTEEVKAESPEWKAQLDAWSIWFKTKWPEEKQVSQQNSKTLSVSFRKTGNLLDMLEKGQLNGDSERGLNAFTKADCAKCHRFGATGSATGPDLTAIANRFSKRETLEAIVEPSKVVSDQYRSTLVVNDHGVSFVGLKVENGDGSTTLILSTGERIRFEASEVVEQKSVSQSSMPEGLLERLTQQEIADLFAYLYNERKNVAEKSATPLK